MYSSQLGANASQISRKSSIPRCRKDRNNRRWIHLHFAIRIRQNRCIGFDITVLSKCITTCSLINSVSQCQGARCHWSLHQGQCCDRVANRQCQQAGTCRIGSSFGSAWYVSKGIACNSDGRARKRRSNVRSGYFHHTNISSSRCRWQLTDHRSTGI